MCNFTNSIIVTAEAPTVLEELGKMAAKIAFYNFEWRYYTLVIFNTMQLLPPLESFLKTYKQSVILKLGMSNPRLRAKIPQFIVVGQDSTEIIDIIRWLDKLEYDNAGKYVIICAALDYTHCGEKEIFIVLSEVNIVNVVYFRSNADNCSVCFSYEKVLPGECNNNLPHVTEIQNDCSNDDCFKSIFPIQLNNFYGCPLIISSFEQPPFMHFDSKTNEPSGRDGDVLKLVAEFLNATLIIKPPPDGNNWGQFKNNNWTGSLGEVFNDIVNASACSLPLTATKYGNFQISYVYNTMDVIWATKLPLLKPSWEKLLLPFKLSIRIILLLIFISIALINSFTKTMIWGRIRKVINIQQPRENLLFYSWLLFLGMPILKMPSKRPLLLIICCWIWFCFIIRTGYQAALIGSLKKLMQEDYFSSFNEILMVNRPYGGPANIREYYTEDQHIYENWIVMDMNATYRKLSDIFEGTTDFVLSINKEIVGQRYMDYNGSKHLQILPEKIVNSPTVMYFKRRSPLVASVNQILTFTIECGFGKVWENRLSSHRLFYKHLHENVRQEPLTYDNIRGCIFMLVFGWLVSIIFFLVEYYCGNVLIKN